MFFLQANFWEVFKFSANIVGGNNFLTPPKFLAPPKFLTPPNFLAPPNFF